MSNATTVRISSRAFSLLSRTEIHRRAAPFYLSVPAGDVTGGGNFWLLYIYKILYAKMPGVHCVEVLYPDTFVLLALWGETRNLNAAKGRAAGVNLSRILL